MTENTTGTTTPVRSGAHCSAEECGAAIIWAETPEGRAQPFDREPNPEGNRVLLGRGPSRPPLALPKDSIDPNGTMLLGHRLDDCVYMPHHASCPAVESFRG